MNVSEAIAVFEDLDPQSAEYKEAVARLLGRLDPTKPLGTELCNAIMALWPTPALEAALLRHGANGVEVFLSRRTANDAAWPSHWHLPGCVYRASDEGDEDALKRLCREFGPGVVLKFSTLGLLARPIVADPRGKIHSATFMVELVAGELRVDEHHAWFEAGALPTLILPHHRDSFIPAAVAACCG